jgi:hypothetical protein
LARAAAGRLRKSGTIWYSRVRLNQGPTAPPAVLSEPHFGTPQAAGMSRAVSTSANRSCRRGNDRFVGLVLTRAGCEQCVVCAPDQVFKAVAGLGLGEAECDRAARADRGQRCGDVLES